MAWVHRCMIVPAALQTQCASLCEQLAGAGGSNMFTTALSADGTLPATHFISSGMIEDHFAMLLEDPLLLAGACIAAGLPVTLEEIQAILSACDVSEDEASFALARLGLAIVDGGAE